MTEAKYLVADAESTGIDVFNDRIVQWVISLADADGNLLETHEWIIDPGVEVPEEAAAVHGFTTEFLRENGMAPALALSEISSVLMANRHLTWVFFNANYDLSILDAEFRRHGITDRFGAYVAKHVRIFDPIVVDRARDKYRKGSRKLMHVADHYGVEYNEDDLHNAQADVALTAKVAARVAEKFGIPTNAEQSVYYREWAEGLEKYLRRGDPEAVVDRDWPLRLKEEA